MTSGGIIIQKTANKNQRKRPYQIDFTQFSKTFLLVSHILPDNHKISDKQCQNLSCYHFVIK